MLIIGAMFVPYDWTRPIEDLYSVEAPAKDAYSPELADLSRALERGAPLPMSRAEFSRHIPQIQVRRLTRAGPMTASDMGEAVELLRELEARIAVEETEGSKDAMRRFRTRSVVEKFTRLDSDEVAVQLDALDRQLELASFQVLKDAGDATCESCHVGQGVELEQPFDPRLLWPGTGAGEFFDGTRLPTLQSPLEINEWSERVQTDMPECTSCHSAHSADDFGVDLEMRRENMGTWVNAYRIEGLLYVQVKIQNKNAAHRVPAGYPGHAYAVVVEARGGDDRRAPVLSRWSGPELPEHLVVDGVKTGHLFHREMHDADGNVTSRHARASRLVWDNRLESGRFIELRFLYDLNEVDVDVYVPWWVMVRLVYLPDVLSFDGGQDVEVRIRQSASDP